MSRRWANKSWLLTQVFQTLTVGSPYASQDIVTDEENELGPANRVLRMYGAVNVKVTQDSALSTGLHLVLGVLTVDQNLATTAQVGSQEWVDRRWLAQDILGCYPVGTGISGSVTSFAYTHRFDWKVRGGRGTKVRKDDAVVLAAGLAGSVAGSDAVELAWVFRSLYELD